MRFSSQLQHYSFIEIAVKQCKSSGIDCKVHGLSIIGQRRSEDDCGVLSMSFLASDNEEEEEEEQSISSQSSLQKKPKPVGTREVQTHVFVWGLNDKDQLGGPKGSKVR